MFLDAWDEAIENNSSVLIVVMCASEMRARNLLQGL